MTSAHERLALEILGEQLDKDGYATLKERVRLKEVEGPVWRFCRLTAQDVRVARFEISLDSDDLKMTGYISVDRIITRRGMKHFSCAFELREVPRLLTSVGASGYHAPA